ncbi:Peroxisomal nicotinamide adenine dinucleotide carrier [Hibiscus syriacus]|uniref:Peroxisomal nicotinamide adenine dinucleotide carrier n=1 Tax=Hibiscus syriacus TaxID=106335 RepID=A0A6A3BG36_HIBSY|nr:Peroxisomal nicotinamide adenine dinucleotide carrier [Hibiscus syriacus]
MSDALINGLAGAGGGIIAQLITYPLQTVNTRQQTERDLKKEKRKVGTIELMCQSHRKVSKEDNPNRLAKPAPEETVISVIDPLPYGTGHAIQELFDEAGFLGFWKGVFPTLIMVSNPAIQFMLYETMLKKLKKQRSLLGTPGNNGITAWEIFLLGALAKLGATGVTYPLNVVKARLQAKQVTTGDQKHQYKGTLDAILKMIRYEGFNGFYKGMSTKIVQSVLAAAVLLMIKEELVKGARLLLVKSSIHTVKSKPP